MMTAENIQFLRHELDKQGIVPLKVNRQLALSLEDKRPGQYVILMEPLGLSAIQMACGFGLFYYNQLILHPSRFLQKTSI